MEGLKLGSPESPKTESGCLWSCWILVLAPRPSWGPLLCLPGSLSHFTVKFFPLFSGQLERGRAVMTVQEVGEVGWLGLSCFL